MELWARITGSPLARWDGWRRFALAAGSSLAHVAVLAAMATMMAATAKVGARPPPPQTPPPPMLSVTLVSDVAPKPLPKVPDPQPPTSANTSEVMPVPPKKKNERAAPKPEPLTAPAAQAQADSEVIPLPPSPTGVPLGLKKLLETNPCSQFLEKMRGDCSMRWAKLAEEGNLAYSPTLEALAKMYPDFEPDDPTVPRWVPKRPSRNNLRGNGPIMAAEGVMPGGPGGGTGVENITGRLPMAHPDPVFGNPNPNWLDMDNRHSSVVGKIVKPPPETP
jgi:hypothetical protein